VPRPGGSAEDDGWVLVMVNNAESQRTDLCIVDAQNIAAGDSRPVAPAVTKQVSYAPLFPRHSQKDSHVELCAGAGPVCTLHLPHHVPSGLHGSWSDSVHLQPPAATPEHWQPSFSTIRH
jgi:all-trans-8'-apo-beta-carotenal 15,15'-oxygenase